MVAQGLDSNWASGPICQGGNQSAGVLPLVVRLGVLAWVLGELGRGAQGAQQAWALLAGWMASRAVAPLVMLARLVHMLVAVEVWPRRKDKGPVGHHA